MADGAQTQETGKPSDLASRLTPLLRNHWYVAALSEEVTRKPMRRTILQQDIVFYRGQDGRPIALQNRCAHRSYPLHLGELNGDRIVCGYHGFEYGPDGRCAHVPALGAERPGIRIQPYPLVEVGPFIWIWTGDPDAVDHAKLVEQPWFTEAGWRYVSGYSPMAANYLGLHENLMDLTHFPFLHTFAKGKVALAQQRAKLEVLPDRIRARQVMPNFPVPPPIQKIINFTAPVTNYLEGEGQTPCMHYGSVRWVDSSEPPQVMTRYIIHCVTPETQTTSHYYWAISRDVALNSQEMDFAITAMTVGAIDEDRRALEEIETLIARDSRPEFREMLVTSDAGGVQVLRLLARWAAEEAVSPTPQ